MRRAMINPCLLCKTASDGNCPGAPKCQQGGDFKDFIPDIESLFDKDVPDIVGMRDIEHLTIWGKVAILLYIIQRVERR